MRTFSEQDFGASGEWLLAPRQLGLSTISQALADAIRVRLLAPLGIEFCAPAGVGLVLLGNKACAYSFRPDEVQIELGQNKRSLPAHRLSWFE